MQHEAITVLSSGIVVDKQKLNKLGAVELSAFFAQLYGLNKRVLIVENSTMFFTPKKLLQDLESNGEDWPLIIEHFGVSVSLSEVSTLLEAASIRKRLVDYVKAVKPPYDFALIPAGWDVNVNLRVKGKLVSRGAGEYAIDLGQLETLWLAVSKYWAKIEGAQAFLHNIKAAGYSRTAEFYIDRIKVGCQYIYRHEIEQFALLRGWAFPEA